jgi:hypothetical protein
VKCTLYNIPSSEIPLLLEELQSAHYWSDASPYLLGAVHGRLYPSKIAISDPLLELPDVNASGPIVICGVTDQGITPEVCRAITSAYLMDVPQHWIIITHTNEVPPDIVPFVEVKTWPQPKAAEIAELLKNIDLYSPELLRQCLGLYRQELIRLLESGMDIAKYKKQKLLTRGILNIPDPHCEPVGLENITRILADVKKLLSPEAEAAGIPFPKGMILMGPPGTGKSLVAKTAAQQMGVPLLCANWGGLLSPVPGQSEDNLRVLLETAETLSPCVLLWDDFDKAFVSSNLSVESGPEKRIAGMMLTWLQERTAPVFSIVTCNRITQLPPELKRRFDWQISQDLPKEGHRYEMFKSHLALYCAHPPEFSKEQWKDLIIAYAECTPDEIGKAIYHCAIQAFVNNRPRQITFDDILYQAGQFTPANIANPEQIAEIRMQSAHAISAYTEDNSEFRLRPIEQFEMLLGN